MRTHSNLIGKTAFLVAAVIVAGCNSHTEKEPPSVLEVTTLTVPPVTATIDTGTNTCILGVTNASGTFKNVPKNDLASNSPFNDIVMQSVNVSYAWDDGVVVPDQVFGVTATIPANGTGTATFAIVNSPVLTPAGSPREGHTATMLMKFSGVTVSGDDVSTDSIGGTLIVNTCSTPPAAVGACCTGGGGCSQLSPANCSISGGTYQGDGTACATANCP